MLDPGSRGCRSICHARCRRGVVMGPGTEVKRLALVIGNGAYVNAPALKNPSNDARAIGKKLIDIGFEVRTEIDCSADKMIRAVSEFTQALAQAGEGGKRT